MYDERMHQIQTPEPHSGGHRKLTYDDLLLFPDDGHRHEIIDGEHYVSPCPSVRHQELVGRLYFEIELWLRQHPGSGRAFVAPLDVVLTMWDVVEPDVLFVAGDQEILTERNVRGAPALVIEVLSAGTRRTDEQIKRRLFAREGVVEYWLVDPKRHAVTLYRRQVDGTFPRQARLTSDAGDRLTTPLLPGLTLALRQLFA